MKKLITILALTATFAAADDLDGRMPPIGGLAMVTTNAAPAVVRTATIYVPGPAQVVRDTVVQERVVERFIVVEDGVSKWGKNDPNYGAVDTSDIEVDDGEGLTLDELEALPTKPAHLKIENDYPTVSDAEAKAAKWLISAGYTWVPGKSTYYKQTSISDWEYEKRAYRHKLYVRHTSPNGAIQNTEVSAICGVPVLRTSVVSYIEPNGSVRQSGWDMVEFAVHEGSVGYFLYEKACENAY